MLYTRSEHNIVNQLSFPKIHFLKVERNSDLCLSLKEAYVLAVQLLSHIGLFARPWTAARQYPLSSTISQSLLKFMSVELVMLLNHLMLCRPLLFLPSIFPSIRVFSHESTLPHGEYSKAFNLATVFFLFLQSLTPSVLVS